MAKRRIILPDDVKNLLQMASELKQMKSSVDTHEKRIETLEKRPARVEIHERVQMPLETPALPIIAATPTRQRKKPLPIEIPTRNPSPAIKVESFGHSVNDPTESISRKYMNAQQIHEAKKSTRV